jgi:hypothetical protein
MRTAPRTPNSLTRRSSFTTPCPLSFVMGNFVLVQMLDGEVKALRDHTFNHYKASGKTSRQVQGIDAYRGVIRDEFGLENYPVEEALAAWSKVTGGTI